MLTVNAYGVLLAAPFFIAILVVSVVQFGILTLLIPFLVVAATAYFLPFGLGNAHVTRLVQSLHPAAGKTENGFIVQLTLSPRIRSGLRAILDDADDIGYLSFTESGLLFQGDSVNLSVPFDHIEQVRPQNIGLRGLFVYGRRIKVVVSGLPQVSIIRICRALAPGSCPTSQTHHPEACASAFQPRFRRSTKQRRPASTLALDCHPPTL